MPEFSKECWRECEWLGAWFDSQGLPLVLVLRKLIRSTVQLDVQGDFCPGPGPTNDPVSGRKLCHLRIDGAHLGPEYGNPDGNGLTK
jgi:hypothetical protein